MAFSATLVALDHAHVRHEVGAWNLALGLGLAAVAWQAHRAAGLLPLLSGLVVAMAGVEIADGTRHGFQPTVLAAHSLLIVALVVVWLLARESGAGSGDGSAPRSGKGTDGPRRASDDPGPVAWPGGAVTAHRRMAA